MKTSKAQIAASERYKKKMQRRFNIFFNKEKDKDIIEHLDRQISKSGYIRQLIRADIEKGH